MSRSFRVAAFLVLSSLILVESKLEHVSVVFRHGDRAPEGNGKELYPNDPYLHRDWFPMGFGGLTNIGKKREYTLGQVLRERYGTFLGDIYTPEDIVARSTNIKRTKMSLLLVLAGLFPPVQVQRWDSTLRWQPIPITYQPIKLDVLLIPEQCPRYVKELKRVRSLPEVLRKLEQFRPLMDNLTIHTGKLINNSEDMWYLYHSLMAEYAMGLQLPEWVTEDIFPNGTLRNGAVLEYDIVSYNDLLKKLNGGTLLKRISDDMKAKHYGRPIEGRKMNLFGGHETNIAALLHTLGVFNPHVPHYSSGVVIELHTIDDAPHVHVGHYLGIPPRIVAVTIPNCEAYCPLNVFLRLLRNVTPTDEDLHCSKNVTSSQPS